MSDLKSITHAKIFPPIGIARVGNSREDDGYFIGPEVPDEPGLKLGQYKDKKGFLKRQASRFHIYGYNAAGEVIAELNAGNSDIQWTVHLANKKADWYQFQLALDIAEATLPDTPKSLKRNLLIAGSERSKLIIDPGPRTISGKSSKGQSFDTGKFFHLSVNLGELRTDEEGRLLVLGGFGLSQSYVDQPPLTFANNDGWHDDVSDGPVDAKLKIDGKEIPVDGAWVAVCPPNYAPELKTVRTFYDLLFDRMIAWGLEPRPSDVDFETNIKPIFERLTGLQWVNMGFASIFGYGAPFEMSALLPRLKDKSPANREFRQNILAQFRSVRRKQLGKNLWPHFYGDALDSLVAPNDQNPDSSVNVKQGLASLSSYQIQCLERWAAGDFIDSGPQKKAAALSEVALKDQPRALLRAALDFCLADAFHPGCELTWPMRIRTMYESAFRLKRRETNVPVPDFGDVLTQETVLSPMGPLNGAAAGDLTKWMAVPWQTDTASCLSGYSFFSTSASLPTFWPARVPNDVLIEADFKLLMDSSKSEGERIEAFLKREDWFRGFVGDNDIEQMIDNFHKLGIVEKREGPKDLSKIPSAVYVESKPDLEEPPELSASRGTGEITASAMNSQPQRMTLRKFGKKQK
ncbi:MAG: LodA/GoxA family CTQ-dependent oxidase [Candidatus Obscuribacterales bacterium]|nr:LodA/GoxA family CTQ-dependent oxidase [Candidatus Obscuribacterales bacterium]